MQFGPNPPLRRRYWQTQLLRSHLFDPLYRIHPLPTGPTHTGGGQRLAAFLVPTVLWDTLCPTTYGVKTFPSVGDHGVQMYISVALPSIEPPDRSVPNIRRWCNRDFNKFRTHFLRWMRGLPTDMPTPEKSKCILQEVKEYVTVRQKPHPREDPVEQNLLSRFQAAIKQWGAHMQKKRHRETFRRLRHFRKAAVTASGPFFGELCDWLMRPFDRSTMSANPQSALAKLPQFAGNPAWDPVAASTMPRNIFHNQPTIRCAPPPPPHLVGVPAVHSQPETTVSRHEPYPPTPA